MSFTLSTIYKAVDKFSGPLKAMQAANQRFATAQAKAFTGLKNTFTNLKNQLFSLAGGLSIAALITIGAGSIIKYDTALKSLSAITGITGKNFDAFKTQVIEVASRTKKSAYEVADAFKIVGSAKPELLSSAEGLSKVSEAAIILSKASGDDLVLSAQNLTGAMNQFDLGANQATRTINVLAAGSVVGAANISRINEALINFGPVAKGANITLEQSVGLIETLAARGIMGAEAGTKLRGSIIKLQQAGYGYASGQFQVNDALLELQKRFNSLRTAKEKDALLTKTFGLENVTTGRILMSNIDQFKQFTKGVTGTSWATKQAEINSSSFAIRLQELKAKFENLIIKGNESSGALNKFGKIINWVTENLGGILTVLGVLTGAYVAYYSIMTAINIVTKVVTAAQWLWNAAVSANPIVLIIIGIIALIGVIVYLIKHWDAVREAMYKFFTWAWSGIRKFASMVFQFMLTPVMLVLKAISKLTGAKWAEDAIAGIEKMKNSIAGEDQAKEALKPVNTIKSANDTQISRHEEVSKQQLKIMLENKTDKTANISRNSALIPVTTSTY